MQVGTAKCAPLAVPFFFCFCTRPLKPDLLLSENCAMPDTSLVRAIVPASVHFTLHRGRERYLIHCLRCNRHWECDEHPYSAGYYVPLIDHLLSHGIIVYKLLSFDPLGDVR